MVHEPATQRFNNSLGLFIQQIVTAAANLTLYHEDHPQVSVLGLKAHEQLHILMNECSHLELKVIEDRLVCNDNPVNPSFLVTKFIENLKQRQIQYVRLLPGTTSEELLIFAQNISKAIKISRQPTDTENIHFGALEVRYRKNTEQQQNTGQLVDFSDIATSHIDNFMDIYNRIRKKQRLNIVGIQDIVHDFVDAFYSHSNILLAIAPLRSMDDYVYVHSTNICLLNIAQARLLGVDEATLNEIGIAAMLHDVGKMFISPDILNKAGKLDPDEWDIIKQHPQLGAEYLISCPGVPCLAVINAFEHHVGYDGKGYPSLPGSHQLHPCSHMTSISDVYDALRTRRSYKEPLTFEQIKEIMLGNAGKSLHPELTRSFINAISHIETDAA